MSIQGEFLCCYEYYGDWHGLQRSSIENVARGGLACVVQIELDVSERSNRYECPLFHCLQGLLSLKQTHFEPRCVLLLPMDQHIHRHRLESQGLDEGAIAMALSRVEVYAEYNRSHPGFFDAFISTGQQTRR
jgi:guanylate kinase